MTPLVVGMKSICHCCFWVTFAVSSAAVKQAWQNSSYFSCLHCIMFTHKMASPRNQLSNDVIITLSTDCTEQANIKTHHKCQEHSEMCTQYLYVLCLLPQDSLVRRPSAVLEHHTAIHTYNILLTKK